MAEKTWKQVGVYFDPALFQRFNSHRGKVVMAAMATGETEPSASRLVQDMVEAYLDMVDAGIDPRSVIRRLEQGEASPQEDDIATPGM